jgi:uncharacterized protein (TIGR04255 family)
MAHAYKTPPIIEAILDFGVSPFASDSLSELRDFASKQAAYSQITDLRELTIQASVDNDKHSSQSNVKPLGIAALAPKCNQAFQARLNGFSFSKLHPYQSWEAFVAAGKHLWQDYRAQMQPANIDRLAIRFINRIDLPLPIDDFGDWLRTHPLVAPEMVQSVTSLLMQFQTPQADIKAHLNFTETIVAPTKPNTCAIVLDIDLFRHDDIPQDENEIWKVFEDLRKRKNEIFEACITDKTRRLFD